SGQRVNASAGGVPRGNPSFCRPYGTGPIEDADPGLTPGATHYSSAPRLGAAGRRGLGAIVAKIPAVEWSGFVVTEPSKPQEGTLSVLPSCHSNAFLCCCLAGALALDFRQEFVDGVFFLHGGEAVVHAVGGELGFGLADGFVVGDAALHAIEARGFGAIGHGGARVARLAKGSGTAMLRDQQVALVLRFRQFLI